MHNLAGRLGRRLPALYTVIAVLDQEIMENWTDILHQRNNDTTL